MYNCVLQNLFLFNSNGFENHRTLMRELEYDMLVTIVSAPETDTPVIKKPMSKIIVEDNTKLRLTNLSRPTLIQRPRALSPPR